MIDDSIKRDAYLKGLKLKSTGLDEETIFARLEKQGIEYNLAKEVAKNVFLQRKIDSINNEHPPAFFSNKLSIVELIVDEVKRWFEIKKLNKK